MFLESQHLLLIFFLSLNQCFEHLYKLLYVLFVCFRLGFLWFSSIIGSFLLVKSRWHFNTSRYKIDYHSVNNWCRYTIHMMKKITFMIFTMIKFILNFIIHLSLRHTFDGFNNHITNKSKKFIIWF